MFILALALAAAAAMLLAVAGLIAARRALPQPLQESHNTVIGHGYAVVSLFTGILLALMVVAVWERYVEALEIAEREANALADLFAAAGAFPEPERDRLRERLRDYAALVATDEWRAMARGEESARAWRAYAVLWRDYLALTPRSEREVLWLQRSIERLTDLGDSRTLRLLHSRTALPRAMWITLALLSAATIAFSYLFGVGDARLHAVISGAIAAALAVTLTLVAALQHPFGGMAGHLPDAFRELGAVFKEAQGP